MASGPFHLLINTTNLFRFFRGPQFDPEFAACESVRLNPHGAAHSFHGSANDGKTDARALIVSIRMDALEYAENSVLVFRFDPDAIVFDPKPDAVTSPFGSNLDLWIFSGGHELHGIAEQVRNGLTQRRLMRRD